MLDTLTVYENIILPLSLRNTPISEIKKKADDIFSQFKIDELRNKFPYQISGGERQRTACARALITSPSLIIADEPTGALDSKNSKNLMKLLQFMNSSYGATILTVTHDPVMATFANRVLFLKDGKLVNQVMKNNLSDEEFYKEIIKINMMLGEESYVI